MVTVVPRADNGGESVDAKEKSEDAEEKSENAEEKNKDAKEKSTLASLLIVPVGVLIVLTKKIFQYAAEFIVHGKNAREDTEVFFFHAGDFLHNGKNIPQHENVFRQYAKLSSVHEKVF